LQFLKNWFLEIILMAMFEDQFLKNISPLSNAASNARSANRVLHGCRKKDYMFALRYLQRTVENG
jgi:hypothetical protein